MELDKNEVYRHLVDCGITYLYHANSTKTAINFIQKGGLLSRGAVEHMGLTQTRQKSDWLDKKHDVWNDIFLDNTDLHTRFNQQNYYGPILFKYDIDILNYDFLPSIRVTKGNPTDWEHNISPEDKHFQNIDEFKLAYNYRSFAQMLTLKDTFDVLPFENYLTEIIIDNPNQLYKNINLGQTAYNRIVRAINSSRFNYTNVGINFRNCDLPYCICQSSYFRPGFEYALDRMFMEE